MSHADFSEIQRKLYNLIGTRLIIEKQMGSRQKRLMSKAKAHDLAEGLVILIENNFPEFMVASELLLECKCALADLQGIMPEFDPEKNHSAWETVGKLEDVIATTTKGKDNEKN
jgi:hypothetical protein